MKRIFGVLVVFALVLSGLSPAYSQTVGQTTEGKVLEEGNPVPNAQVVLTNMDTGKTYKAKTDKSGKFLLVGVAYGNYQVDVLSEKGEKIASQKTSIGTGDTSSANVLVIPVTKGGLPPAGTAGSGPASPKLTKEQLAKIESDNKKIAGLNSLINDAQTARQAQDWPKAENALKQLIAAAPDSSRWDFYYALGDAQSRSNKPEEAAQTFEKGIQIAQSLASGATPPDPKNPNSAPAAAKSGAVRMLTSQGNAYLKLQKQDEAIASLKKAADLEPSSAVGQYNLCGVEFSAQKFEDAKATCNKFLQLEPNGARADEVKAFLTQMGQK